MIYVNTVTKIIIKLWIIYCGIMIEREMIVLDIDYITEGEKPVIRLFGREPGENPKRIIAFDNSFEPYFYMDHILI